MLAPAIQISPITKIRRHRELPIPGNVIVRQGQKVEVRSVIAEVILKPEHILLDIARGLNVSNEKADDLIQRAAGELVDKDDLIAGPVGILRRVIRAPQSGRVVVAGEGQVLIEVDNTPFEIHAGLPGTVTDLIPNRGAVVETDGAIVQGVWGNGNAEFGLMQSKLNAPDDTFSADHLDMSLRGTIVLGGYCADPKVFRKAAEIPLRGLILASMASELIPIALKKRFPIVVLEGFGRRPMNTISYNILTTNNDRDVALNAKPVDHYTETRPEVIIPLKTSQETVAKALPIEDFTPGNKVRVSWAPGAGRIATIETLHREPIKFPSGVRALAAAVLFEDNQRANIPLANLEVVV